MMQLMQLMLRLLHHNNAILVPINMRIMQPLDCRSLEHQAKVLRSHVNPAN